MRPIQPVLLVSLFHTFSLCQQVGNYTAEKHPNLNLGICTKAGGCTPNVSKLVLDANWRWLHGLNSYSNCYSGTWNSTWCPDPVTCAKNCALEGADYVNTYGVTANGGSLTLLLYPSGSTGSRLYLMSDDSNYRLFKLKNQEFTFDVDVSGLPCGTNGAVYFTTMPADGGKGTYLNNNAGAAYGTGYCDAQCPQDIKFINGEANLLNYQNGKGRYGACCPEMDVWEANSISTAYTAHTCNTIGPYRCDGQSTECGSAGVCDQNGCDFNPYRMGNKTFYGSAGTVKTNSPNIMTVVTQFITSNNTAAGKLTEIRRTYVQGGKVISNAVSKIPNVGGNSLSDTFCTAEKTAFNETNSFKAKGGFSTMDKAMGLGMVLTLSVWVDDAAHMLWLDSNLPANGNPNTAGVARGSCSNTTGNPPDVKSQYPNAQVKFSNLRFGEIGSTFP